MLCEPWNKRPFAPLPNLDYVSKTTSENGWGGGGGSGGGDDVDGGDFDDGGSVGGGGGCGGGGGGGGGGECGGSPSRVPDRPIHGTFGDPDGPHRLAGKFSRLRVRDDGPSDEEYDDDDDDDDDDDA